MIFKRKSFFLIGVYFLFTQFFVAQNQKVADSLIDIYNSGNYKGDVYLLLRNISQEETNPEIRLKYAELTIEKAVVSDSVTNYLYAGHLQKGNANRDLGNYTIALNSFFESLNYATLANNNARIGAVSISIADIYSEIGNSENALIYYNKGIEILRKINASTTFATALFNLGDEHLKNGNFDEAIPLFKESSILFKNLDNLIGTAYNLGNMGLVHAEQGKDDLAIKNINEAIVILEKLEDHYGISAYLTYMSDIYSKKNDRKSALKYSERSLDLAQKYGLKKQISDANLQLSELYEKAGNQKKSFQYYKNYIVYRDSIKNIESVEEIADIRTKSEVSQKQIEVNLLEKDAEIQLLKSKKQTNITNAVSIVSVLVLLLAFGLYRRYNYIKKTKSIIEEEKNRSDHLLLNILPEETAQELKENGKVTAKKFDSTTVLFTDFKDFTHYAENLSPEKLVETVDFYFSKFDEIFEKYDLEKIKTVGDAYMCAGGLHFHKNDHALKMVQAAFDIKAFVDGAIKNNPTNETRFEIRIGINTGPVVAGVVGTKKFAYDIWGDTVNIASRMESCSEPGKINISHDTYEIIKESFDCVYRGEIDVKNRGTMKMYFVNGLNNIKYPKMPKAKINMA